MTLNVDRVPCVPGAVAGHHPVTAGSREMQLARGKGQQKAGDERDWDPEGSWVGLAPQMAFHSLSTSVTRVPLTVPGARGEETLVKAGGAWGKG